MADLNLYSLLTFDLINDPNSDEEFWNTYRIAKNKPNLSIKWRLPDTEELFDHHMSKKDTKRQLKLAGWTKDNISYRFNNYGFRTDDDFDVKNPKSGNFFLGCSITEGTGLNVEDTWGFKINQKLGGVFYNFGQSGTGLDTQYRLFKTWAPIIKPKRAFTLGSFEPRREFFTKDRILKVNLWDEECQSFIKYIESDNEIIISYKRTFDAIKMVAFENNIELYSPTSDIISAAFNANMNCSRARDIQHPGPIFHDSLVENFDKWVRII